MMWSGWILSPREGDEGGTVPRTVIRIPDTARNLYHSQDYSFALEPYTQDLRLNVGSKKGEVRGYVLPLCCTGGAKEFRPGKRLLKEKHVMRSDLVFGALSHVSNRYQLCQLASKATRKLHRPNTRLQDTTNEVLGRFQTNNPGALAPVQASVAPVETRRAA